MRREIRGLKSGHYSSESCSLVVSKVDEGVVITHMDYDLDLFYKYLIKPESKGELELLEMGFISENGKVQ